MMAHVYSATQLRVAIRELLQRQSDKNWPDLAVVYESDIPTSPLSVKTREYAQFTETASTVCTSADLHNYRSTGTLEGLLALLTRRVDSESFVTLDDLRAATDADNITEVLRLGCTRLDDDAALVCAAYKALQLCRGYDMRWECGPGKGVDSKKVVLRFLDLRAQPAVRITVYSHRPSLGFERRTMPSLAEAHPQVRVTVGIAATRVLSGALAVAFARLAWQSYMEYLMAAVLQQDMP
jgi:hypothetical protein